MIKILNIISDTNIGGAGRTLLNYLKYADRDEFEISVLLPRDSELTGQLRGFDVKLIEAEGFADKSFSPKAMRTLTDIIRAEKPDIVHTHGSLTGRMAAKRCGKTAVFTRHSAFPFPAYIVKTPAKYLYRFIYSHYADRIITVSGAGREQMLELGIPEGKLEVIMNGAEPVERIPEKERSALREDYGVEEDEFLLGALARIEEYKGHKDMLNALKILSERGKKTKLIIAGTGSYEPEIKQYARELKIEDSVIFAGFIENVAPILSIMDLQLNASYLSETSSLSIIEGMSMALPAVASNCCGNPYLIDDGVSGLLFEPRSSVDMADKIETLMEDREYLKRLGEGARDGYEKNFTGEIFAKRIENIYKKAVEGEKHGK